MSELSRFGVSVEDELLQSFDGLIAKQGYGNRSEALRDLMRDSLVKSKLEELPERGEALGSLTLVYDHHANELSEKMNALQHEHPHLVVSVLHVHISHNDCLEVIVLRGDIQYIRQLSDGLLSLKGVKHGQLFVTLPIETMTDNAKSSKSHTIIDSTSK